MKKLLVLVCTMFVLVGLSMAQDTGKKKSDMGTGKKAANAMGKAVSMAGKISDGGKTFVSSKDNTSYSISNAEDDKSMKASDIAKHDGHDVKVKGHWDNDKKTVHVVSVTMPAAKPAEAGKKKSSKKAAAPSS